jgi:hypothetical protein
MNKFAISALAVLSLSCNEVSDDPHDRHFNILFRYGVGARNELNTFENSYTKDLILDGSVTIRYVLPLEDRNAIEGKLQQLEFFSYPDTFRVVPESNQAFALHPYQSYFFRVQMGTGTKTLYWADSLWPNSEYPGRRNLEELVTFIRDRISWKPEIQRLPPARGGYL